MTFYFWKQHRKIKKPQEASDGIFASTVDIQTFQDEHPQILYSMNTILYSMDTQLSLLIL